DRVGLGTAPAVTGQDPLEPGTIGLLEQRVEPRALDLVGPVAEHALDRRALVRDGALGVEDRDQIARVRDQGAEARLVPAPVQVLGERRALGCERYLRRERLQ